MYSTIRSPYKALDYRFFTFEQNTSKKLHRAKHVLSLIEGYPELDEGIEMTRESFCVFTRAISNAAIQKATEILKILGSHYSEPLV